MNALTGVVHMNSVDCKGCSDLINMPHAVQDCYGIWL
jgi:hypothetical protein